MVVKYRSIGKNWCFVECDQFAYSMISTERLDSLKDKYTAMEERALNENCFTADKVRFIGGVFNKPMVAVAHLQKGNETTVYFFGNEAYLLNNEGKTVEKIMY